MNIVSRAAAGIEVLALDVRDAVAAAPVKHMDETGIRVRGCRAWLHVACTEGLSHFRVGTGRGDVMRDATGVAVHDHWRPYVTIPGTVPALCAAHLLRELQDRVDFDDEAWAATMARRLRRAIHPVNLSEGKPLPARLADRIGRRTDSIVAAGIFMHESRPPPPTKGRRGRRKRRRGYNLVRRLQDNREGVLGRGPDLRIQVAARHWRKSTVLLFIQQHRMAMIPVAPSTDQRLPLFFSLSTTTVQQPPLMTPLPQGMPRRRYSSSRIRSRFGRQSRTHSAMARTAFPALIRSLSRSNAAFRRVPSVTISFKAS